MEATTRRYANTHRESDQTVTSSVLAKAKSRVTISHEIKKQVRNLLLNRRFDFGAFNWDRSGPTGWASGRSEVRELWMEFGFQS